MGWYAYECGHCGKSVSDGSCKLHPVVVIAKNLFAKGGYNDYGQVVLENGNKIELDEDNDKKEFNIFHTKCWDELGNPVEYNGKFAVLCQ